MGHSFWRNMSELHGSVAQAIHGLARNALDDAARKANLSFVSSARLFEKAWSDSHLIGLLVMLLHLEVALAVLVAFGASHDEDADWALKQYLDNFADACSVATVGLCLYGASLMQFNLRVLHSRGKLIAEFKDRRGLSANILFGFMLRVLACSSAAVVVIASFAYYFGSGRNFREYVQRYTDEVADVCSILCFADWCAFSLAFAAANHKFADAATAEETAIIEKNRKRTFNRIYRKRICQISLAWAAAIVVASQYIAPASVKQQLGFFGVAKEYLDEAADIASICLFALFLSSVFTAKALVSRFLEGLRDNRVHANDAQTSPHTSAIAALVAIISLAFGIFKATMAPKPSPLADLFKHHLDQVADVCSICTVFGFVYYNYRLGSLTSSLNQVLEQLVERDAPVTPRPKAE